MRWIASLLLLLLLAGGLHGAGADDQYLEIYNQILQADSLQQGGQMTAAAMQYRNALNALQKLHEEHPTWNPVVMTFRLNDLSEKVNTLAKYLPATNAVAASVAPANTAPADPLAALQAQVQDLSAANNQLQMKLKEALSVQPAAIAPGELAKAEERNLQLQRTNALLAVTVEQLKTASTAPSPETGKLAAELAALKTSSAEETKQAQRAISDLKSKLADATAELEKVKTNPAPSENIKQITTERDHLKKQLETVSKALADREAHPAPTPGAAKEEALNLKLLAVEKQRDDLLKQVAATPPPAQTEPAGASVETERLRARLAVLEAAAIPYTAEEQAVMNGSSKPEMAAPVVNAAPKRAAHSITNLSPSAKALVTDAQSAAMERDYALAEKKYLEVLAQDPDNVYVLVNLGNVQFDLGHLDDCEKNAQQALALDPQDPFALYLLGILRYRQEKLDESFDALSRSASFNATNANTQYALGRVLSDKGLLPAAETAFRKTLQVAPAYADAHYGLALVYATEKPPSMALARWHYQKSLDLGRPKNPNLEKLLSGEK